MKKLISLLVIVSLVYAAILYTVSVSADGAGGSITYCTVKQPDGRLQLCTPIPGFVQAGNNHHYPTPTHKPKKTRVPTRTPTPTISATATRNPFCLNGAGQWVICPAIPNGPSR